MFAYCNNNPVMFADDNGCLPIPTIERIRMDNKWAEIAVKHFWGAIHTAVQLDIVANAYAKGYTSILKEWQVNGGRADILDASTGEVWEVKHNGHSSGVAAATISLAKYIPGTYSYNGNTYSTTLGHGGAFSGSLSDTALTGLITHYDIVYWTEQPGVILYDFKITPPKQEVLSKVPAGGLSVLAFAIGIATAVVAGGYGLNAGSGKAMGGAPYNELPKTTFVLR